LSYGTSGQDPAYGIAPVDSNTLQASVTLNAPAAMTKLSPTPTVLAVCNMAYSHMLLLPTGDSIPQQQTQDARDTAERTKKVIAAFQKIGGIDSGAIPPCYRIGMNKDNDPKRSGQFRASRGDGSVQ
jgi:hypothetical protein